MRGLDWTEEDLGITSTGETLDEMRQSVHQAMALLTLHRTRVTVEQVREYLAYRLGIPVMECYPMIFNEVWCLRARRVLAGLTAHQVSNALRSKKGRAA